MGSATSIFFSTNSSTIACNGPNSHNRQGLRPEVIRPGAYIAPGQRNQRFTVTIPEGVRPEELFAVIVNGHQIMVRCPPNNSAGDRLIVTLPRRQAQQHVVTVPPNVRPNEQFRVLIDNQEVMVTCPPGVRPNQRISFTLPERPVQPAPYHHMYEVAVPSGVTPGQPFALIADGQRVMVTCPPNVQPGQKIRFLLPVQLSQEQFQAIKVDYDLDGWTRCLGSDLKFHWVYTSSSNPAVVHKIPFNVDSTAYVRELITSTSPADPGELRFIDASLYAMPTTVQNTQVNYQTLSSIATLSFQQKREWIRNQFSAIRVPWEDGHIKLKIRRSNILSDSIEALESIKSADMHKIFRFQYICESGVDTRDVAREWYPAIIQELLNPDVGVFLPSSMNPMHMDINPKLSTTSSTSNEKHFKVFHFAGRVLGKALMDGQAVPIHLVQPLYKHLLGYPVTLHDLEHIDSKVYRSLVDLLDLDNDDEISRLSLYFSTGIKEDRDDTEVSIPLIPGGDDILVTKDNLEEYIRDQLKYYLFGRYKEQLREFLKGFYDVVPEPLLAVLNYKELELLFHDGDPCNVPRDSIRDAGKIDTYALHGDPCDVPIDSIRDAGMIDTFALHGDPCNVPIDSIRDAGMIDTFSFSLIRTIYIDCSLGTDIMTKSYEGSSSDLNLPPFVICVCVVILVAAVYLLHP